MSPEPLPRTTAWRAVARCFEQSMLMLARSELDWPRDNVGRILRFADGTTARVFRETTVAGTPQAPCFLAVAFRLRLIRGRGHAWFETESILNTPLFVGFPGFASKLWLAHDSNGLYRGLYEWDGAERAEGYARSLWRVLEIGCEPGSIDFRVFAGLRRDEVLSDPSVLDAQAPDAPRAWWRVAP
jgi:hypothetical protein